MSQRSVTFTDGHKRFTIGNLHSDKEVGKLIAVVILAFQDEEDVGEITVEINSDDVGEDVSPDRMLGETLVHYIGRSLCMLS